MMDRPGNAFERPAQWPDLKRPLVAIQCADLSSRGGGLPAAVLPAVRQLSGRYATRLVSFRGPPGCPELPISRPTLNPFAAASRRALAGACLVHTHGLWTSLSVGALIWRRAGARPTVVSPHGMLEAWALSQSRAKKAAALALFERAHLDGAGAVHALTVAEAQSIRSLGVRSPIAIIPNGVEIAAALRVRPPRPAHRTLLFLGRLHPKKGISELIAAFALAAQRLPDWRLVIAGWDDGPNDFRDEARASGANIVFPGPLFGDEKLRAYAEADAFVLPSHSEGLPMTVLEAWAAALPVLMTDACQLPEGFAAGAAARIALPPSAMADVLVAQLLDPRWLAAAGAAGRDLVDRKFHWSSIAQSFAALYDWLLGRGQRPDFVHE